MAYDETDINPFQTNSLDMANTHSNEHLPQLNQNHSDPVVNQVHSHLHQALLLKASDIHLEPTTNYYRYRLRVDGQLIEYDRLSANEAQRALARLKIMAHLDTAEYRLPQDGRFSACFDQQTVYCRLSTCPTTQGEKAVVRLLNHQTFKNINQLDLTDHEKHLVKSALDTSEGMILVCGPTGSGKTTTLYAALDYLNQGQYNIVTAEDPAEINLSGINQVNINPKIGLRFDQLLRSFLRQDPDIMMVGEIRDIETAEIAVKAAQTGHLVLSTLHSNSATKAFTRLSHMGINQYDLLEACQLIIAQRLLRRLCDHCKQPQTPPQTIRRQLGLNASATIYQPQGCHYCHQGYLGRFAIHELMRIEDSTIVETTLHNASLEAFLSGLTSYQEIMAFIDDATT